MTPYADSTLLILSPPPQARSITNRPKALHPDSNVDPNPSEAMKTRLDRWRSQRGPQPEPVWPSSSAAAAGAATSSSSSAPGPQTAKRKRETEPDPPQKENVQAGAASSSSSGAASYKRVPLRPAPALEDNTTRRGQGAPTATIASTAPAKEAPGGPIKAGAKRVMREAVGARPDPTVAVQAVVNGAGQQKESSSGRTLSPAKVVQAKEMIVQAKEQEKRGDLHAALRLYQAAQVLLPEHQKLATRLNALQDRIRAEYEAEVPHPTPAPAATAMEQGSPDASADVLHSAIRSQAARSQAGFSMDVDGEDRHYDAYQEQDGEGWPHRERLPS